MSQQPISYRWNLDSEPNDLDQAIAILQERPYDSDRVQELLSYEAQSTDPWDVALMEVYWSQRSKVDEYISKMEEQTVRLQNLIEEMKVKAPNTLRPLQDQLLIHIEQISQMRNLSEQFQMQI